MKQLFSMEVFVVKMKLQKLKEKTLCRAYMVLKYVPVCVQIKDTCNKGNNSIILISCSKIVWKASKIFSLIQLVYTY